MGDTKFSNPNVIIYDIKPARYPQETTGFKRRWYETRPIEIFKARHIWRHNDPLTVTEAAPLMENIDPDFVVYDIRIRRFVIDPDEVKLRDTGIIDKINEHFMILTRACMGAGIAKIPAFGGVDWNRIMIKQAQVTLFLHERNYHDRFFNPMSEADNSSVADAIEPPINPTPKPEPITQPEPASLPADESKGKPKKSWREEYNQITAAITKPKHISLTKEQIKNLEGKCNKKDRQLIAILLRIEYRLSGVEIGKAMNISSSMANKHIADLREKEKQSRAIDKPHIDLETEDSDLD